MQYDTIIYGGGIYAGVIIGASLCISRNLKKLQDKKIVIFTVGIGDTKDTSLYEKIKNQNFSAIMQA